MKILREIDKGGFGVVEMIEGDGGAVVARKLFSPQREDADGRLRGRFIREVRTQSMMNHPNIMQVLEAHLEDDPPWFTMPLASSSYREKIKEDRARGMLDIKPWVDILAGVEEVHRLGYVHRDLKPANILCVGESWMVSDFGTVLPPIRDTTVLTRHTAFGSENYASPEQARDFKHATAAADIYSLGCILHDLLGNPYHRTPYSQISVDGPYSDIFATCTNLDPNLRYRSVAELREALFDIWQSGATLYLTEGNGVSLDELLSKLRIGEGWQEFIDFVDGEDTPAESRTLALRAVNAELISTLHTNNPQIFEHLVAVYCEWVESSRFDFDYCDILGDRLRHMYNLGLTRVKLQTTLACMELAVYHNRWHVMRHVVSMLKPSADMGLVDRMAMELAVESKLRFKLKRIETVLSLPRTVWHDRIGACL